MLPDLDNDVLQSDFLNGVSLDREICEVIGDTDLEVSDLTLDTDGRVAAGV